MSPDRSRLRRVLAVVVALSTTALLAPAAASASHVKSPRAWKASNTYLVRVNLDGRARPKLNPRAKVDYLKAGQWVRITCQTTGQSAYGSRVWNKVGRLYVPDHYMKTYTDGFVSGAPRCKSASSKPPKGSTHKKGPSRATLAKAVKKVEYERVYGSNYGIYKKRYPNHGNKGDIIWKNDGCSVPAGLVGAEVGLGGWLRGHPVAYYSKLFQKSCDRHDFGYRNYGPKHTLSLKLDPTERRRASINTRFHKNMDYQCKRHFSHKYLEAAQRGACYKASDAFYTAVKYGGKPAFFG